MRQYPERPRPLNIEGDRWEELERSLVCKDWNGYGKWPWGRRMANFWTCEAPASFSPRVCWLRYALYIPPQVANAPGLSCNCCYITSAKSVYLRNIQYLKRRDSHLSPGGKNNSWCLGFLFFGGFFLKTREPLGQICTSWVWNQRSRSPTHFISLIKPLWTTWRDVYPASQHLKRLKPAEAFMQHWFSKSGASSSRWQSHSVWVYDLHTYQEERGDLW